MSIERPRGRALRHQTYEWSFVSSTLAQPPAKCSWSMTTAIVAWSRQNAQPSPASVHDLENSRQQYIAVVLSNKVTCLVAADTQTQEYLGLFCFGKGGDFGSYKALADCLEYRHVWANSCSETPWEFQYSFLGLLWEKTYL